MSELRAELEQARKAKMDMECRLGGQGNMETFAAAKASEAEQERMAKQEENIQKLRNELRLAREEHHQEAQALQMKLRWYAENQKLIDQNDRELSSLRDLVQNLREMNKVDAQALYLWGEDAQEVASCRCEENSEVGENRARFARGARQAQS